MATSSDRRPTAGGGVARVDIALEQLCDAVDALAAVDARTLPAACVTQVVEALSSVDGRLDGVQAGFVRAAAAAGVPRQAGAPSTTAWLRTTTGRSGREASRTDRLARAIDDAPALGQRLASGTVGPDQAHRIARGIDRGTLEPADANDLLDHASHLPPGAFDRETRRLEGRRHQRRLREQEQAAHAARSGTRWRDDDGSLRLDLRVAAADGDLVTKAIDAFVSPDPAEVPDELRRTPRQLVADAMVDICRAALGSRESGDVAGEPPRVTVLVSPEMLAAARDAADGGATGTTDLDTVLSAEATAKLLCDATLQRVVVDAEGQVLDVGRATRKWPPAVRTAIRALDGGDRTPGSDLPPGRCVIHHVRWWRDGGRTSVENGVLLSPRGHDMIHEEGWTLELDPVTRICTWTSPDGETVLRTHPRGVAARGDGAPHDIPALDGNGRGQPGDPSQRRAGTTTHQPVPRPGGRSARPDPVGAPPAGPPRRGGPAANRPRARGDPPGAAVEPMRLQV